MIVVVVILIVLLVGTVVITGISNSMTQIAMSDALRAQAQATQALAMTELVRELTVLVGLLAMLAVVIMAGVVVYRRSKPAKVANITPRPVIRGEVVERPQLPQGTPIEQLTQLMTIKLMADMMKERENRE